MKQLNNYINEALIKKNSKLYFNKYYILHPFNSLWHDLQHLKKYRPFLGCTDNNMYYYILSVSQINDINKKYSSSFVDGNYSIYEIPDELNIPTIINKINDIDKDTLKDINRIPPFIRRFKRIKKEDIKEDIIK